VEFTPKGVREITMAKCAPCGACSKCVSCTRCAGCSRCKSCRAVADEVILEGQK